jgi:DNA helicase-2/ATP-dependent DNA helicase PcrA
VIVASAILEHYPDLNEAQREVIGHMDGPMLVIAGPGSGKTYSIVLRALNLLLLGKAQPRQIILCTFTEKAAFEMRDRLAAAARTVGYEGDLSELTASTIHSLCNRILTRHRHRTELGHNYDTLDQLTQALFIFEHFDDIVGPADNGCFLGRWKTKWTTIEGIRAYFDQITEELVDPQGLITVADPFIHALGESYVRYERALLQANRTDFAHLQHLVYDLLSDPATADAVTGELCYVTGLKLGDKFWLYVVERAEQENFAIYRIPNPPARANNFMFDDGWSAIADLTTEESKTITHGKD